MNLSSHPPMPGPDFICVGMPKAGTGWLYDQVQYHPDFWMPPVKELLYLHRDRPTLRYVVRRFRHEESRRARRPTKSGVDTFRRSRPADERDIAFLREAAAASGQPLDLERYASLFRFKGEMLSGDISPPYADLSGETIEKIAASLPQTKIILLVRDPVARAWSRVCMAYRGGALDASLLENPQRFRIFFESTKNMHGPLLPTKIVARWRMHAPASAFRYFLLDDIAREPEKTRREILTFVGADANKKSQPPPDFNRKADNFKLEMPPPLRDILVDYFREELKACGDVFGGAAQGWAGKYRV